MQLENTYKERA